MKKRDKLKYKKKCCDERKEEEMGIYIIGGRVCYIL